MILILFTASTAYAQTDILNEFSKQAITIDSLKKVISLEKSKTLKLDSTYQSRTKIQQETISILQRNLSALNKFKVEKVSTDALIRQKTDSITTLISEVHKRDTILLAEKQKGERKVIEAKASGKNEMLEIVINIYKNKSFDDLIRSTSKLSIQRDLQFTSDQVMLKSQFNDLSKYFNAMELLNVKFNETQIQNSQIELDKINQKSSQLVVAKELLENYELFNDGLKETIGKIIALDKHEKVTGMPEEIQKRKRFKLMAEISSYIFDYDFKFGDYPYLDEVILEIIKQKQPDPDADISQLIYKLH